jgi:hypothetical protein
MVGILNALIGSYVPIPTAFDSIATASPSGVNTITFSSIPGTYKALQIRANFKVSAATTVVVRLNNVETESYARHGLVGSFGTVTAYGNTSQSNMPFAGMSGGQIGTTIYQTVGVIDILDYASTSKNKVMRAISGTEFNAEASEVDITSGLSLSTAAVTSITILTTGANFTATSTFSLYGVK